jgi:NhaA family Na+:H+ antiporter
VAFCGLFKISDFYQENQISPLVTWSLGHLIMPLRKYLISPIKELARQGQLAGIMLISATVLSMFLSNGDFASSWLRLWDTEVGFSFLHKSVQHWINDGLMVIFFLLVGLEIKRELADGELSSVKQAILPAFAALGGMIVPAIIFVIANLNSPETMQGWAIPTATDIAFSLGILSLLGKRVPLSLKVFLTALAIIDDLGAILIIAFFYSSPLDLTMILIAAGIFGLMVAFNRYGLKDLTFYIVPGVFLWYFVMKSGVHPTIAGVLTAVAIPLETGEALEHRLFRPVNYFILPLFALANTAIPLFFNNGSFFLTPLSIGIILGLFLGKPAGIVLCSYLPKWMKLSEGPAGIGLKHLIGLGFTAGVGFTMSIFISSLSFPDSDTLNLSKLAIICGSIISGMTGLIILSTGRNTGGPVNIATLEKPSKEA